MEVDWGQAFQIGGIGFGLVFGVLTLLALVMWLLGVVIRRIDASEDETAKEGNGE